MPNRLVAFVLLLIVSTVFAACGTSVLARPDSMPMGVRNSSLSDPAIVAQRLRDIGGRIDTAMAHAQSGDLTQARHTYLEMEEDWEEVGGSVRKSSAQAYEKIWDAMSDVRTALVRTKSPDPVKVVDTLRVLRNTFADHQKRFGTT